MTRLDRTLYRTLLFALALILGVCSVRAQEDDILSMPQEPPAQTQLARVQQLEDLLHTAALDFYNATYRPALKNVEQVLAQDSDYPGAAALKDKILQYMQQQEQQQQEQQQDQEQQQQEQDQQQEQEQNQEQQEQQGQQEPEPQGSPTPMAQGSEQEDASDGSEQQASGQEVPVEELGPEEAERLLDALEDDEQQALKERVKARRRGQPQVDKDW